MRIRLRPKVNRHGKTYLFAGVEALNAVIFIQPLEFADEAGNTHELVVKPYESRRRGPQSEPEGGQGGGSDNGGSEDYSAAWEGQSAKPPLPRAA